MTELEKIAYAKSFIDKLANGINPINEEVVPDDDLINNVRISRCLFYVSEILERVIDNKGFPEKKKKAKAAEYQDPIITEEARLRITPYDIPVLGSEIVKLINSEIPEDKPKIKISSLARWLLSAGFLEKKVGDNYKIYKQPTDAGVEIGIQTEIATSAYGRTYFVIKYTPEAQQFIIDNIDALIQAQRPKPKPSRYLAKWTEDEIVKLTTLFEERKRITEIAEELERTVGATRSKLKALGLIQ